MLCFLCGYILNVLPRIMKINTHRISFLFAELISMCYVFAAELAPDKSRPDSMLALAFG